MVAVLWAVVEPGRGRGWEVKLTRVIDENNLIPIIDWGHGKGMDHVGGYCGTVEDAANDLCLAVHLPANESMLKERHRHKFEEGCFFYEYKGSFTIDGKPDQFHFTEWHPDDYHALIGLWREAEVSTAYRVISVELGPVSVVELATKGGKYDIA